MKKLTPLIFTIPIILGSCTKAELDSLTSGNGSGNTNVVGALTIKADNPGLGGSPCTVLSLSLTGTNKALGMSPELMEGGEWSRTFSSDELAGLTKVRLAVNCTVTQTDANGNTVTATGYSVSDHTLTNVAQSITVTGPRTATNFARRVEWSKPVPGVLPLDP